MNDARSKAVLPISLPGEYALRALIALARGGRRSTALELATATGIPAGYLAKILQQLAKSGLVDAKRGAHGGFSFAREASEITVADVLAGVGCLSEHMRCPTTGGLCDGECPLHEPLRNAMQAVEEALQRTTLDMLVRSPGGEPRTQNGEVTQR